VDARIETTPLRLKRSYRGYHAGEVIQATGDLAKHLVDAGVASVAIEHDRQPMLFRRLPVERAIVSPAVEHR
jgi:hypothetical protein